MDLRTLNPGFWRDMLRNAGDNSARNHPEGFCHCSTCDLVLGPRDSCIHIPAAPTPACGSCGGGRNAAPVAVVPPHSDEGISA